MSALWAPVILAYTTINLPTDPPRAARWSSDFIVRYHINAPVPAGLTAERFGAAVDAAFTTWERPCSTLRFERLVGGRDLPAPAADGQNTLRFELQAIPPEVDPAHTIAFTSIQGVLCTGTLTEVDMVFNAVRFGWSDALDAGDARDIETITLHEAGHLLGLDHSAQNSAVMFAQNVERVRRALTQDDLDGLCAQYPADAGQGCARDADCARGQVCAIAPDSALSVAPRCIDPVGRAGAGEACAFPADACASGCANNLCRGDGVCSALCVDNADCPRGETCFPSAFDGGLVVDLCQPFTLCEADATACPDGEVCVGFPHPTEPRFARACAPQNGDAPDGAACRSPETCAGGVCQSGRCTRVCDDDAQCGFPRECLATRQPLGGGRTAELTLCATPEDRCNRDSDCPEGRRCAYAAIGGVELPLCLRRDGADGGAACDSDEACASRVCLDGTCSATCQDDDDCPLDRLCEIVPVREDEARVCVVDRRPDVADASAAPVDASVAPADAAVTPEDATTPAADAAIVQDAAASADAAQTRDATRPAADAAETDPDAAETDPDAELVGPGAARTRSSGGGCAVAHNSTVPVSVWAALSVLGALYRGARRARRAPPTDRRHS